MDPRSYTAANAAGSYTLTVFVQSVNANYSITNTWTGTNTTTLIASPATNFAWKQVTTPAANITRQVATVAAMQALTGLINGDLVQPQGRTASGDTKMPLFLYSSSSTATANLGEIFVATAMGSGRFLAKYNGPAYIEWYGAVGDGATDNATAFTNALAYHGASTAGVTAMLAAGPGNFYTSLTPTNRAGLWFKGAGGKYQDPGITTVTITTANTPNWVFAANTIKSKLEDVYLTVLTSPASTDTNCFGVYFESLSSENEVNGVGFNAHNYSVGCLSTDSTWQHTFNNLYVNNAKRAWIKWPGAGTTLQFNHPYFQGGASISSNSVTVTNIVKSAGTNLTVYFTGTIPPVFNTNLLVTLTTSQSAINNRYFISTISGNQIGLSMNSDPGTITGTTGTIAFVDGILAEAPIQLGVNTTVSFIGADFEHVNFPAGPFIDSSANVLSFDQLHLECITSTGSYQIFKQSAAGGMSVGAMQLISSGVGPGYTATLCNPNYAGSSMSIGPVKISDYAKVGGTLNLSLVSAGNYPVVVGTVLGTYSRPYSSQAFDSTSNAVILNTATFPSTITVAGAATVGGTLAVTGATTLTGNLTANGTTATLAGNVVMGASGNIASATHTIWGVPSFYAQGQNPVAAFYNYGATAPIISLNHAIGTYASPTVVTGDLGSIQFNGYNGSYFARGSRIYSTVEQSWLVGGTNGASLTAQVNLNNTSSVSTGWYVSPYSSGNPDLNFYGNLNGSTAGKTLTITSGANALSGTVTLVNGTNTITSSAITTSTVIDLTVQTSSGVRTGALDVIVSAGSATITTVATDAGTYVWTAIKKN